MGGICLAVLFGHTQSTVSLPVMERCAEEVMATVGAKCPSTHLGLEPKHTSAIGLIKEWLGGHLAGLKYVQRDMGTNFQNVTAVIRVWIVPRKQVGLGIRDWMD
ncbi:hypothetical protein HRR83_006064 [Exophiala dermatitidis]|uniref:Uncharacterized protein n=1 Tax=Exophiala dermatitidis TaxID=5970 RepID=A0AAN6EQJ2_EXODE|nr:hypothetical protein HRR74_005461 [Exophiala dermatitidis]KAJ4517487.1 hypothetical protein HRR73_004539 [Exophiala dermatitidis]KAJ4548759.1 hypothetical protein HRR76_001340 [Exophiala dermatitidis]KAJ4552523.1 hypothetical protein HRR77_002530 [Exophiala dermatitidis]KAJ4567030.1 hypothetical protein HRR81_007106 [Exophiala dermatitidis]